MAGNVDRRASHERFRDKLEDLEGLCNAISADSPDAELLKQLDRQFSAIVDFASKSNQHRMRSSNAKLLLKCSIKVLAVYFATSPASLQLHARRNKTKRRSTKKAVFSIMRLVAASRGNEPESLAKLAVDLVLSERLWRRCGEALCCELVRHLCAECGLAQVELCRELCRGIDRFHDDEDHYHREACVGLLLKLVQQQQQQQQQSEHDVDFLRHLLDCYRKSTSRRAEHSSYREIQPSLEMIVKSVLTRADAHQQLLVIELMTRWCLEDDDYDGDGDSRLDVLDYASTLEYAAQVHEAGPLHDTFTEAIFCSLMKMIGSEVRYVSLLGNRVLQLLIDRGKNLPVFKKPRIFFENIELKLNNRRAAPDAYSVEDRSFLKQHRELVHRSLLKSIVNHCDDRSNLEASYSTICLLALEIPCGFTAATFTCLMMNAQKFAQNREIGTRSHKYYVHALVISVLTFVCWLHKAELFHAYLNTVFKKRAKWAPHYNPPMLEHYEFAAHHVLWDKPDLFLLDWEVRFGLWHRFRLVNDKFESTYNDDNDA